MRVALVLVVLLAGCADPLPEDTVVLTSEEKTYSLKLKVDPDTTQARRIDFTIFHDNNIVDVINYEVGNHTERLGTYIVDGGSFIVNVIEDENRYLRAYINVEECASSKADAVVTIQNRSPGNSGLSMEYGCL